MLNAYTLNDLRLQRLNLEAKDPISSALWVDLIEPNEAERERVQQELGQGLATRPELEDIEASARFF
ncbi:hypothetical protein [Photobacterium phosphoreum]